MRAGIRVRISVVITGCFLLNEIANETEHKVPYFELAGKEKGTRLIGPQDLRLSENCGITKFMRNACVDRGRF